MARAAMAAGSRLAAETGAEVLRGGGSAVDAVIAGALAACVAEPVLAGLMGGGFLMVQPPTGPAHLLDGFVQTPRRPRPVEDTDLRSIEADFGDARQTFHIGAGAIACPGLGPALAEAHARHGRMPLTDLAAPAIAAAARGTPIEPFQARVLGIVAPIYRASPEARALYLGGAETAPEPGTPIRNAALADLLDSFAREGARFLQEGEPAAALVALCAAGGHLEADDLRRYRPVWRTPFRVARQKAVLSLNPVPALGGAVMALALALIGADADIATRARALALSLAEREIIAAADDPALAATDPQRLAALAAALAAPRAPRGTTHLSAVDASGLGAALSISNGEGCGLVLRGMGLMPNNMLGEADLVPEPGRFTADVRLASMMAPTALSWSDGRVALLGSGGSTRIPGAITQVALALIDRGMALEDAIAAPRLHALGERLDFEDRIPEGERAALLAAYPDATGWVQASMFFGGVHGVLRDARGTISAAGDPRRDGVAVLA